VIASRPAPPQYDNADFIKGPIRAGKEIPGRGHLPTRSEDNYLDAIDEVIPPKDTTDLGIFWFPYDQQRRLHQLLSTRPAQGHRDVDSDWNPAQVKLTFDFTVKMDKQIRELGLDVFRNYEVSKAKLNKCWSARSFMLLKLGSGVGHKFVTQNFGVISSITVRIRMSLFILSHF
jgi:hypothetical protein